MRVLVTGAAGFIGSWLVEGLLNQGHQVIGVDDYSGGSAENLPKWQNPNIHFFRFFQTDICSYSAMSEIFMGYRPEIVVHLACCAREGASFYTPYEICRTNSLISSVVLELGIKHKMKKFVFFSSMASYGRGKPPFDETAKKNPVDLYGDQKMMTERMIEMLAAAHKSFAWTVILPHNVLGERQSLKDKFRNVAAITMNRLMRGEPVYLYGPSSVRSFSYVGDSLPAFLRACEIDVANGEKVNIGGKVPIKVRRLLETIVREFPEARYPEIVELPRRYGEVEEAYSTSEKSERLLGYEEKIGWEEGVKRMCRWAKARGPQEWTTDHLPIPTDQIPLPWCEPTLFRSDPTVKKELNP